MRPSLKTGGGGREEEVRWLRIRNIGLNLKTKQNQNEDVTREVGGESLEPQILVLTLWKIIFKKLKRRGDNAQ